MKCCIWAAMPLRELSIFSPWCHIQVTVFASHYDSNMTPLLYSKSFFFTPAVVWIALSFLLFLLHSVLPTERARNGSPGMEIIPFIKQPQKTEKKDIYLQISDWSASFCLWQVKYESHNLTVYLKFRGMDNFHAKGHISLILKGSQIV